MVLKPVDLIHACRRTYKPLQYRLHSQYAICTSALALNSKRYFMSQHMMATVLPP